MRSRNSRALHAQRRNPFLVWLRRPKLWSTATRRRRAMRSPLTMVFFVLLIAPAVAGAQATPETALAAPPPGSAPAPADVQARAPAEATPARSRNFFGQAMAELTRSVQASQSARAPEAKDAPALVPANAAATTSAAPAVPTTQVAAQDRPE